MVSTKNSIFTIIVIMAVLRVNNYIVQAAKTGIACQDQKGCEPTEDCFENECYNECDDTVCDVGFRCATKKNKALCICDEESGYQWNHQGYCSKVCEDSSECRFNQECRSEPNYNKHCYCKSTYHPNPEDNRHCDINIIRNNEENKYPSGNIGLECITNDHCKETEICEEHKCFSICYKMKCIGDYDICIISDDRTGICLCRDGYKRNNILNRCEFLEDCQEDSHCDVNEICNENMCINPCLKTNCRTPFEVCEPSADRTGKCVCAPGYSLNSENNRCERECTSNDDCKDFMICKENQCVDACTDIVCDNDLEVCVAHINHIGTCDCVKGHIRNPETNSCEEGCNTDNDCTKYMACQKKKCIPVCDKINCHKPFDLCLLNDNHTATCSCEEGFSRTNPRGLCEVDIDACNDNNDCDDKTICEEGECIHVCSKKICRNTYETCVPQMNHTAICDCKDGYIRIPDGDICELRCKSDSDCHVNSVCGKENSYGYHICICKPGYTKLFFDRQCRQECAKHGECSKGEWCSQGRCVKATSIENVPKYL